MRAGEQFGKYRIIGLLGTGGMGSVYEAVDTSKGRTVALKVLADQYSQDERFRERFQRESRAAAMLQEPHVVPIHDWGEIDGYLYIDMRLVQGMTLNEVVAREPLAPARAVSVVSQVAAALDAAHAAGLIHRDVKPQNIMVTSDDFAYLVDFGIAEVQGDSHLTMTGTQVGSMAYMAPERFRDGDGSPAVDVYSLACVLFEAATGSPPFRGAGLEQVIAAHLSAPPPRPSTLNLRVPVALDEVVARGMAKQADDRYGSAGALARAAARALDGDAPSWSQSATMYRDQQFVSGPPSGPMNGPMTGPTTVVALPPGAARARWVVPVVIAAVGALLLGGIGIVIGMLAGRDNTSPQPAAVSAVAAPTAPQLPGGQIPPPPSGQPAPPVPAPSLPTGGGTPPLMIGADNSAAHDRCDDGWSLTGVSGWGTHSGRGSEETSCYFARSVLSSYWNQYGNASRDARTVFAPGAVNCGSVDGATCNGPNFVLRCQTYGADNWITCTGGNNARVYLF